ncbi:ADAMTS protein 3, partial [Biomphalaria glabrata]
ILVTLYCIDCSDSIDTTPDYNVGYNITQTAKARWEVTDDGPCTSPCGGMQVRQVRCVRDLNGQDDPEVVNGTHCPLPIPEVYVPCPIQICTTEWILGNYSECSTTCGTGTQNRTVICMSTVINGHRYLVSPSACTYPAPETMRKCHVADCPHQGRVISIESENSVNIQLRKSKKLKVVIGGEVKLIPGTTLIVQCPVKNYPKKLVNWSAGYRLIPLFGRVKSTIGGLKIMNADPDRDSGLYTCTAGDKRANIIVSFLREDDPQWSQYKSWTQHSRSPNKKSKENESTDPKLLSYEGELQKDPSDPSDPLTYMLGRWSQCTAVCGSSGEITRNVTCSRMSPKMVTLVPEEECQKAGLVKPETTSLCGQNCATWHHGQWSECQAKCGQYGVKTRALTCAWEAGEAVSTSACPADSKPASFKKCRSPACTKNCVDKSKRCGFARTIKVCRYLYFRQLCCASCMNDTSSWKKYKTRRKEK